MINKLKIFVLMILLFTLSVMFVSGHSFPYAPYTYPYGLGSVSQDQPGDNAFIGEMCEEYDKWKEMHVTAEGASGFLRVRDNNTPYNKPEGYTPSEAIGYGMLLAVYMDDLYLLDQLWEYAKLYFNTYGLMQWAIRSDGTPWYYNGSGVPISSFTDADIDIATALIFACKKWGLYESDVRTYLSNILAYDIEPDTYVIKPGNNYVDASVTKPACFLTASLKIFSEFDSENEAEWLAIREKCYEMLSLAADPVTGLVPNWCTPDGSPGGNPQNSTDQTIYSFDAIRTPWRISLDYLWYGEVRAIEFCEKLSSFFEDPADEKRGVYKIWNGYELDGTLTGDGEDVGFRGAAGLAAMASSKYEFSLEVLDYIKSTRMGIYYQDTLRMLFLLQLTGNFPNLINTSIVQTPSPTPEREDPCPVEPTPIPCTMDPVPTLVPEPYTCCQNIIEGMWPPVGNYPFWQLNEYLFGDAEFDFRGGVHPGLEIFIYNPGMMEWSVQIYQLEIGLVEGKAYTFSFSARTGVESRPITLNIIKAEPDYDSYIGGIEAVGKQIYNLSCQWQNFTLDFIAPVTDEDSMLEINLGRYYGDVFIDNIVLQEKDALFLCGDVNDDGEVSILDAVKVAQFYVGLSVLPCFNHNAANVDCNSPSGNIAINITDALKIAQYYVGLSEELYCCSP